MPVLDGVCLGVVGACLRLAHCWAIAAHSSDDLCSELDAGVADAAPTPRDDADTCCHCDDDEGLGEFIMAVVAPAVQVCWRGVAGNCAMGVWCGSIGVVGGCNGVAWRIAAAAAAGVDGGLCNDDDGVIIGV